MYRPPIDGWQSITGLERSTHNLADPSRNILLQKPLTETDAPILAMLQCPTPGDLTPPLMQDIQNIKFTPDKRPKLTADQAVEAENYFRALRKLNSAQPPMSKAAEIDPNNSDMFKPTAMAQGGVDWPITKSESSSVTLLVKGHARAHTYKAALAGVHQQHGQLIKWVDRSVEGDARIHLKDGTILQATSSCISATKSTEEAITIIVSYAVQRKMRTVSITSSSQKIRNVCARRLIRAGIAVSDHDLQHIVNDEQIRAEMITKLIEWRSLRNATFNHDDIDHISKLAMAIDALQPYFDRINRVYPKSFALIASDNDALNALQNGQVDVGISEPGWANPNSSFKC